MTFRQFFQVISYLQYPLMLLALYFAFNPIIIGLDLVKENPNIYFENMNRMLIFMGLGVSFSALQDTTKTQNRFSRKIYEDPVKGKILILAIILMIGIFLVLGLIGFFSIEDQAFNDLATGMIIMGLGMFGFLKAGVEMFENHRLDRKNDPSENS